MSKFIDWWKNKDHADFIVTASRYELVRAVWQAAQPQWQLISSAPNDTTVLISVKGTVVTGYYHSPRREWVIPGVGKIVVLPDFWMPLPNPPVEGEPNV